VYGRAGYATPAAPSINCVQTPDKNTGNMDTYDNALCRDTPDNATSSKITGYGTTPTKDAERLSGHLKVTGKRPVEPTETGDSTVFTDSDTNDLSDPGRICCTNACLWTTFWMLRFCGLIAGIIVIGRRLMHYVNEYKDDQMEAEVSKTWFFRLDWLGIQPFLIPNV